MPGAGIYSPLPFDGFLGRPGTFSSGRRAGPAPLAPATLPSFSHRYQTIGRGLAGAAFDSGSGHFPGLRATGAPASGAVRHRPRRARARRPPGVFAGFHSPDFAFSFLDRSLPVATITASTPPSCWPAVTITGLPICSGSSFGFRCQAGHCAQAPLSSPRGFSGQDRAAFQHIGLCRRQRFASPQFASPAGRHTPPPSDPLPLISASTVSPASCSTSAPPAHRSTAIPGLANNRFSH